MKRVVLSITGTALGLVALLSFKTHGHPMATVGALPSAGLPVAKTTPTPTGSASSGAAPQPGSAAPTRSTAASPAARRTIAGSPVDTPYGLVQVQVVVTGSRIDNVSFLQLTAYDGHSQQINSAAAPILLQETMAAQSANINAVSGASYTSQGYAQSLQSALDQAGIK